jgi:hypothetical protein
MYNLGEQVEVRSTQRRAIQQRISDSKPLLKSGNFFTLLKEARVREFFFGHVEIDVSQCEGMECV